MILTIHCGSATGKPKFNQISVGNKRVERAEVRPDLVVPFDGVAQLKIVTRKSAFHLSEMITLDIALLNASSRPLFFRNLSELQIKGQNPAGQTIAIQEYGVAERALVPASFVRLAPGEIIVRSFQLLAGCDKRAFAQIAPTDDNDLTWFKNGLFLNWDDACVRLRNQTLILFSLSSKTILSFSPRESERLGLRLEKSKAILWRSESQIDND